MAYRFIGKVVTSVLAGFTRWLSRYLKDMKILFCLYTYSKGLSSAPDILDFLHEIFLRQREVILWILNPLGYILCECVNSSELILFLFVNSSELIFFLFGEWNSSEPILMFPAIKDDLSGIWRNCFPLVLELTGFKKNL